jgi:hypothetical protein
MSNRAARLGDIVCATHVRESQCRKIPQTLWLTYIVVCVRVRDMGETQFAARRIAPLREMKLLFLQNSHWIYQIARHTHCSELKIVAWHVWIVSLESHRVAVTLGNKISIGLCKQSCIVHVGPFSAHPITHTHAKNRGGVPCGRCVVDSPSLIFIGTTTTTTTCFVAISLGGNHKVKDYPTNCN